MKVHTVTKPHALDTIHASGSLPMKNAPIRIESRDDRMVGSMLAAEVMAEAKGGQSKWLGFAWRLIDATVEARAVFLNQIKADKAAMTKAQTEFGINEKHAKSNTASVSVMVSQLTTIAKAFNGAATVDGWMTFANAQIADPSKHCESAASMREHGSMTSLYAYAKLFSQAKAGRRSDTLLVKLGKFIKANKPGPDADATEQRLFEELVEFYNNKAA